MSRADDLGERPVAVAPGGPLPRALADQRLRDGRDVRDVEVGRQLAVGHRAVEHLGEDDRRALEVVVARRACR